MLRRQPGETRVDEWLADDQGSKVRRVIRTASASRVIVDTPVIEKVLAH
jgi:hypothetical protein